MAILGEETVTGVRYAAGTRSAGVFVPGATSPLSILASVQPAEGEDLELLPEGQRTKTVLKLYTETLVKTASETAATLADVLTIDSKNYQVHHVEQQRSVIPHYKVLVVRVQA